MDRPIIQDQIDWHGCEAVQFNPERLSGRATVGHSRMDADGVLINFEGGLSVDEIVNSFGVPKEAVEKILAFAADKCIRDTA